MSSSNYLYLLFLLSFILLACLSSAARAYVFRAIYVIARVVPTPRAHELELEGQPHTSAMSDVENERWKALVRESEAALEKYLIPSIDIELAALTRCIAFRVFLVVFLGVDPDTLAFANVQLVTNPLSEYYQNQTPLSPEAESILQEWLPNPRFSSSLDRILPAYEVLWRIIAALVVTCEENKSLRWVMMDFRDNPRERQYRSSLDAAGKSVSAITDDVVNRLEKATRQPPVTESLNCIKDACESRSTIAQPPTVQEALKLAALLASMVVGQVGVHYEISADGTPVISAAPWGHRKIVGMTVAPQAGHVTIHMPPSHASISKQTH